MILLELEFTPSWMLIKMSSGNMEIRATREDTGEFHLGSRTNLTNLSTNFLGLLRYTVYHEHPQGAGGGGGVFNGGHFIQTRKLKAYFDFMLKMY